MRLYQILLLSPTNRDWAKKIRYAIFDEVGVGAYVREGALLWGGGEGKIFDAVLGDGLRSSPTILDASGVTSGCARPTSTPMCVRADAPSLLPPSLPPPPLPQVHCIDEEDGGSVWEHILLLLRCPFLALSATVGNPGELCGWLRRAREVQYKQARAGGGGSARLPGGAEEGGAYVEGHRASSA